MHIQAGYREGITAGKESALQQGFDDGFAHTGAPLGRELGILRGLCSALIALLSRPQPTDTAQAALAETRDIAAQLANVRFSDIVPPDLEALAHAREHLDAKMSEAEADKDSDGEDLADPASLNEELKGKREMEGLEDLMAQMTAGGGSAAAQARPKAADIAQLKGRLLAVAEASGLRPQWS